METELINHYTGRTKKRARILDNLIKGASIIVFLATIPEFIYGIVDTIIIVAIILFSFFCCYLLNKKGHTNFAANLVIFTVTLFVFVQSIQTGLSSMAFCFYMPLLIGIPFIIDHKKLWLLVLHMVLPILLCTYLLFWHYSVSYIEPEFSKGFKDINGPVTVICALIQCGFFAWFVIRDNNSSEQLLIISKETLEKRNQDLIKTNKEMDHLVYCISHDLRAPIASALGLIEISKLERDLDKLNYYETLKERCLRRLDNFIIDILNYLKNNRLEIELTPVEIKNEIEFVVDMNSSFNEAIDVAIDCEDIQSFHTDKNRLRIILNNLISNAFRYSKQSDVSQTIQIHARKVNNEVVISIRDNGIGIHANHLDKIFDMFFKTDDKSKGSGLGLYITKEALDKMNGSIEVWSEKGVGSVFTFRIPEMPMPAGVPATEKIPA